MAFPLKNPYLGANPHPGSDVTYVTKIDAAGQLVYSTYLGGSVTERLGGIAADSLGNAYVTGLTSSPDFPTQNPIMAFQGGYDVYVTKLTPDGSALVYSTYLGGSDSDVATGIAVDGGEAYVTGQTSSNDFPIANAFQANYAGSGDGFVAKLDASGASLAYSTYVGGSAYDYPSRVTVDSQGQAAITGRTQSPDYPTFRAFQGSLPSPTMSTFVTKLSDTGRSLVFSTYLGGSVDDEGFDVASDANGRTWVAGSATSADFPVRNAYQPNLSGSKDGFVSCFDASGGLAYSTFFGGSQDDDARGISVFASGAVAFGGTTGSSDLPVMNPIQPALAGQNDAFVATLDGAGSLVTSSYLGGADNDGISDLDAGSADTIVATGSTLSTDFPSVTPFQATPGGFVDAFVTRIARCNAIALAPASLPSGTVGAPYSQTITGSGGSAPYTYAVTAGALPPGLSLSASGVIFGTPASTGSYGFTVTATDSQSCTGQSPYALSIGGGGFPDDLVAGQGLGMPNPNRVRVFVSDGTATSTDFLAYGASAWGVNVAPGNVQAATNDQILTGPGPGATLGPQARSFLRDGTPISKINFYAYGTLRFGLNVAGASVDADTFEEILTGAGPGAVFGPHVRGWNFDNVAISSIAKISYFAYGTLKYGVNVGSANLDADAFDEVLTGAGSGAVFSSNVRGWNYDATTVSAIAKINFNAFTYQGFGVNVAGGDVDADGFGEIACAPGPGVTHPARFLGFDYDGASLTAIPGFDVTIGTGYGGRVGLGDLSGDGSGDLVAGFGPDPAASSTVSPFLYTGSALVPLLAIDPFPGAFHGVSPAAGNLGF
ncbi:MAG: SBBP repeat-containing protein [Acidobacteriota bacterium]